MKPLEEVFVPRTAPTQPEKPEWKPIVPSTGQTVPNTTVTSETNKVEENTPTQSEGEKVTVTSTLPALEIKASEAATLPQTGESDATLIFGAAAMSILAGLGLIGLSRREEQ